MFTRSHSVLCVCRINNVCTLVCPSSLSSSLYSFVVVVASIILFGVVADARLYQTAVIHNLTVRTCGSFYKYSDTNYYLVN